MMRKKVLSIFLALVMVLCLVPMTVLAEGEENSWDIADGDITVTATAGGQTVTQAGANHLQLKILLLRVHLISIVSLLPQKAVPRQE